MTASSTARRVTVVTPQTRVDVALPAEAAIAEVVPQLTALAGITVQDPTATLDVWRLSRLGADPFDPSRSVAACGIQEGELLYLTATGDELPAAVFDDVIAAVADAAEALPGTWRPATTRWAGLAAATLAALGGLVLVATAGTATPVALGLCALTTVVLLTAGGLIARGTSSGATGAVLSVLAVPAAAAGALLTTGAPGWSWLDPVPLLVACAAVLLTSVIGYLACAGAFGVFVGLAGGAVAGLAVLLVAVWVDADPVDGAAVTGAVLVAIRPLMPMIALRLARLEVPGVPADVEQFRTDRPGIGIEQVAPATARATAGLTALHAVTALGTLACVVLLLRADDLWATLLAAVLVVATTVRMRAPLRTRAQRLVLFGAGLAGAALVVGRIALDVDVNGRLLLVLIAAVAAGVAVDAAVRGPGRQASPYWGRFADVVEFVALAAVLPLTAQVLDLFALVRGISG